MALGELLAVGAVEQRQVGVDRRLGAERLEHEQLLGRVGEVVLAADDVADRRVHVVDRDGEVVEDRAVGAGDHRIVEVDVGEGGVAADHVAHDGLAVVGHVQAHRARRPRPRRGSRGRAPCCGLLRPDVVGRRVGAVGVAGLEQPCRAPRGGARPARTGRSGPRPSPGRASPARRGSGRRSRASSARGRCPRCAGPACRSPRPPAAAGQQPVVERGPRSADVERAGGRGGEADAEGHPSKIRCAGAPRLPRLPGRRAGQGARARPGTRLRGDPDLQPEPAGLEAPGVSAPRRSPPGTRRCPAPACGRC